jgi:hypothetical protein
MNNVKGFQFFYEINDRPYNISAQNVAMETNIPIDRVVKVDPLAEFSLSIRHHAIIYHYIPCISFNSS